MPSQVETNPFFSIKKPWMEIINTPEMYLEIFHIQEVAIPTSEDKEKSYPCKVCNKGMISYKIGPMVSSLGVREIRVNSMPAFRCDNCELVAYPLELDRELERLIRIAEAEYDR